MIFYSYTEYPDYHPFGMLMFERSSNSSSYRYSFQGQEQDDEIKGEGNSVNYKYRMHDPRIGRFFAVDPLFKKYPFYSPFAFSGNRVIDSKELEGLEPAQEINGPDGVTPQIVIPASDNIPVPVQPGGLDYIPDPYLTPAPIYDNVIVPGGTWVTDEIVLPILTPYLQLFYGITPNGGVDDGFREATSGEKISAVGGILMTGKGGKGKAGGSSRTLTNVKINKQMVRVDVEYPQNTKSSGNVHIQVKGKGGKDKIYLDKPADLDGLPKSIRKNKKIQQGVTDAFKLLNKFKEGNR